MKEAAIAEATHRTSKLRGVQGVLAPYIPGILGVLDYLHAFPDTKIHEARMNNRLLYADDITLSQLQMTGHICREISVRKHFHGFDIKYILTSLLNGADGPVARHMGTVSKEGGIKDASVDRLSEVMVLRLIGQELGLPDDRMHELQVACQLSTLTKAACEMTAPNITNEGGVGSMIERRKILFFIMKDLMKLKRIPSSRTDTRHKIEERINGKLQYLVDGSKSRALERIQSIAQNTPEVTAPEDPDSTAADEARKYAGIVLMNNLMGIDIVGELNALAGGAVTFPSSESLRENRPYVEETLTKAQGFLDEALQIAGY